MKVKYLVEELLFQELALGCLQGLDTLDNVRYLLLEIGLAVCYRKQLWFTADKQKQDEEEEPNGHGCFLFCEVIEEKNFLNRYTVNWNWLDNQGEYKGGDMSVGLDKGLSKDRFSLMIFVVCVSYQVPWFFDALSLKRRDFYFLKLSTRV